MILQFFSRYFSGKMKPLLQNEAADEVDDLLRDTNFSNDFFQQNFQQARNNIDRVLKDLRSEFVKHVDWSKFDRLVNFVRIPMKRSDGRPYLSEKGEIEFEPEQDYGYIKGGFGSFLEFVDF